MQRGGLPTIYDTSYLFRLPTKNRTGRTTCPDHGFRALELGYDTFMPDDPRMSVVRLFHPDGEPMPRATSYEHLAIHAISKQVAFGLLPRHAPVGRLQAPIPDEARQKAVQHINKKLLAARELYLVLSERPGDALYAAKLRSLEYIGGKIVPNVVDRYGDQGLVPSGLVFAAKPLALRDPTISPMR